MGLSAFRSQRRESEVSQEEVMGQIIGQEEVCLNPQDYLV